MANCECCGGKLPRFRMVEHFCSDLHGGKHLLCSQCMTRAHNAGMSFWYDEGTGQVNIVPKEQTQIRRLCEDCGNVFMFNCMDVYNNRQKAKSAGLESAMAVVNAIGGSMLESNQNTQIAKMEQAQIRNFNVCPRCGSRTLRDISSAEAEDLKKKKETPASAAPSPADEILKFKNLLDNGIITQEEFDAKKKQLLGL